MTTYTEAPADPVHQHAYRPDRLADLRRLTLLVFAATLEADRTATRRRADRSRNTSKRGRR